MMEELIRRYDELVRRVERLEVQEGKPVWVTWTATLTQGIGVTFTATQVRYMRLGKLTLLDCHLDVTSAGTGGQPIVITGVPIAIATPANYRAIGWAVISDVTWGVYHAAVMGVGANTLRFSTLGAGNNYLGQVPNFALANGDGISFGAMYEAV